MSYSVSGNKWIFPVGVADVYCVYHIYISSFHQPAPPSIIKLYSYNNSTDWKEMCVHNMSQEINLVTEPATHSMHYMCQRSRIYSGHLCSTGVEKGKKKIGFAIMNWTLWVLQIMPMQGPTGIAIHQGSKGWPCRTCLSECASFLLQLSVLRALLLVLHTPPTCSPHPSQEHLLLPDTPCPLWKPFLQFPAPFRWATLREFHFAQVIVHPAKMPRRKWLVSHLALQLHSHKFLWPK